MVPVIRNARKLWNSFAVSWSSPFSCFRYRREVVQSQITESCDFEKTEIFRSEDSLSPVTKTNVINNRDLTTSASQQCNIKKMWKCKYCTKLFVLSELKEHNCVCSNKKKFKCNICGKVYRRKLSLANHLVIHTSDNISATNEYAKFVSRNSDVYVPKYTYTCKLCDKTFKHENTLSSHIKAHFCEKKHKCDICGKMFAQRNFLKTHTREEL